MTQLCPPSANLSKLTISQDPTMKIGQPMGNSSKQQIILKIGLMELELLDSNPK